MKKILCQYAIIRFAPFVETEEFANVGVLMIAPKQRYFGFKLETRRFGRITRFFEEIESTLYKKSLSSVKNELDRIHGVLKEHGFDRRKKSNDVDFANQLFSEVIRPRESIIRYSEPRVVLTEDPNKKLEELFSFYVERNFVTKQYKEGMLEDKLRKWLVNAHLGQRFHRAVIGDDEYQAKFPFVEKFDEDKLKVIKPLHLAQDKPNKIIDHGGAWVFRLWELKRRNLMPEKTLFTVAGPESGASDNRMSAFAEIVDRLKEEGVEVANYKDREQIIEFARPH